MYKVKFINSGHEAELIGFVNNKIIIRFNDSRSIGTVGKIGYVPVGKKTFKEIEEEMQND